jgi:hypothetical protein
VTGKEGPYEIGMLNVLTRETDLSLAGNNVETIPQTNFAAIRLKRDVLKRSHIGGMVLSKDSRGGHYNRTFALDGRLMFNNNLNLTGYAAKTQTTGMKGDDHNLHLQGSWGSDLFYTRAAFSDIGANFNPEMGFLQWRDVRKYYMQMFVSPRPDFLNTRQTHFSYELDYITDHDNVLQYRTIQPGITNVFNDESYVFIGLTNYYDLIPAPGFILGKTFVPGGIYKYNVFGLSYRSDYSRRIGGSFRGGAGTFYDGTFRGTTLAAYVRPNDKLSLYIDWNRNLIDVPFPDGKFTTNIVSGRLNYSFNTRLYAKWYLQWNDFDQRWVSNFLLHFIHTPGSDFYLVYNEEHAYGNLSWTNRALIAKLTYLFRI